jgi:hypothetical protein
MDWNQAIALGTLALVALFGLGLVLGLVQMDRGVTRWVSSGRLRPPCEGEPAARPATAFEAPVTATDLYVVRSNLDAVLRQVEDLERRLRYSAATAAKPAAPATPARPASEPASA